MNAEKVVKWVKDGLGFDDMQRLLNKLAEKIKAFHTLTPAEIGELLANAEKCTFDTGTTILKEGSSGGYMYIIFEGEAIVTKKGKAGDIELNRLYATDSFGEMALADRGFRSASVRALKPCVLVRLNEAVLSAKPQIALKFYRNMARVLSERLRSGNEMLAWRL